MTVDRLINLLVTITLVEMMLAVGLGVTFADLAAVARNWQLVVRACLANYVVFPAVTVGLLLLLDAPPAVAAGFLILAVCPGAPFGPPLTALARGNVAVAAGLMVILAGSSAVVAPVLLRYLMSFVSSGQARTVDTGQIVHTLLLTQLLPLCVGVAVRQWRPQLAAWLRKPADLVSKILNLAAVALILSAQFHLLSAIRPLGFAGMVGLLISSWLTGWMLGGRQADDRQALTLTTALRNVGIGLVIATGSFAGTPAITGVVVYGLLEVFGTLLLALKWGRSRQNGTA